MMVLKVATMNIFKNQIKAQRKLNVSIYRNLLNVKLVIPSILCPIFYIFNPQIDTAVHERQFLNHQLEKNFFTLENFMNSWKNISFEYN